MNLNIIRKHNDLPEAPKVFFVPVNTLMVDYYKAFMDNGFELHTLNFEGKWDPKQYLSKYQPVMEQKFLQACKNIKPDWVFMLMDQPLISTKTIQQAKKILPKALFTNWTGDVRAGPKPGVLELGKVVDITLIVSTGQIELYKSLGFKDVKFLQAGVNVNAFMPLPNREQLRKKYNHDIVFCANNHGSYPGAGIRRDVATKLSKIYGNRFAVYGRNWDKFCRASARKPIPYNDQNIVYNGSKIVISANNFNDIDMYFSARQLNGMASGTLTVSCYIPGLEKYFENKKDLVWFKSADECVELVKYYLAHEDEAEEIGMNGSKKVLKHHTKYARIKEISKELGFFE